MNGNKRKSLTITGAGDILMNLEFKPEVLSKEYIVEHGTYFDGDIICWSGEFGDQICSNKGVPFTGLLYELYQNSSLAYYSFYENGVKNGIFLEFYPSGKPKSYGVFNRGLLVGRSYEWYENGMLKKLKDHYKSDYHYMFIEYDENGNITRKGDA
jgi:antitoxin component YwqK of YwqJK toxin-antitoxin module